MTQPSNDGYVTRSKNRGVIIAGTILAFVSVAALVIALVALNQGHGKTVKQQTAQSAPTTKSSEDKQSEGQPSNDALVAAGSLPSAQTKDAIGIFEIGLISAGNGNVTDCYTQMDDFRTAATKLDLGQQHYLANYSYPSNDIYSDLLTAKHLNWICNIAKSHKDVDVTDNTLHNETIAVRQAWQNSTEAVVIGDIASCIKEMETYRTGYNKLSVAGKIYMADQSLPATPDALTDAAINKLCASGAPDNA